MLVENSRRGLLLLIWVFALNLRYTIKSVSLPFSDAEIQRKVRETQISYIVHSSLVKLLALLHWPQPSVCMLSPWWQPSFYQQASADVGWGKARGHTNSIIIAQAWLPPALSGVWKCSAEGLRGLEAPALWVWVILVTGEAHFVPCAKMGGRVTLDSSLKG